jgi:hypothetical protein
LEKKVARTRTTKKLAQRIDLNYFKRPTPLKRAKFWLSVLLPLLAAVWISSHAISKDSRAYSSGRMSAPHAILEKQCASCHVQKAGFFSAKAEDQACLSCHDGPIHHTNQAFTPDCATCHVEHRGRMNIAAVSDNACATCHANLHASGPTTQYVAHIRTLGGGHPEFATLRENQRDPTTIKLNHALHLKLIRRGPTGPMVQLDCGDCHRPAAAKTPWNYSDVKYLKPADEPARKIPQNGSGVISNLNSRDAAALTAHGPSTGRERMAPVTFANSCASCHLLSFDKRFDLGVPHDKPAIIHAFLKNKFQDYAAAHPSELRETRDPNRELTGRPIPPMARTLTATQWVAERTAEAEELLWRKTCRQCHELIFGSDSGSRPPQTAALREGASLPQITDAKVISMWLPHAKFDHDAHGSFTCTSCHEKALYSTDSNDLLLPGIATCQSCHAPGPDHAESRCFECHTYHDWSKRKEITPRFNFPPLQSGGR